MQVIQIYSSESTYVSTKLQGFNIACTDFLEIGNYKENTCECNKSEALMKFEFECLNSNISEIKKVFLNLSVLKWTGWVQKSEYELVISVNEEPFDNRWINWQMKPKKKYYETVKVQRQILENHEINIDITELAKQWIKGEIPNYGITIETKESEILIYCASSCSKMGPKLTFYCDCKNECNSKENPALEISVANRAMELIENQGLVKFDTIARQVGDGIVYNPDIAELEIRELGAYSAQWWISIDGSGDIGEIAFELIDEFEENRSLCSVPVFVLSQVFGNSILNVTKVPLKVKLLNKSGASIQYANVTVQSNFTIFKI